ncbi:hypothetical protein Tco_1140284, partial [Tanacetum coccineum]
GLKSGLHGEAMARRLGLEACTPVAIDVQIQENPKIEKLKTFFEVTWDDVWGINHVNQLQEFDSIAQVAKGPMSWFLGTLYEALLLEHHLHFMIDVNDCVKTNYNQIESDEPRDDNIMDYSDQKELSDEYYTNKFRKVNKEDRREDDKLRRQQCLGEF